MLRRILLAAAVFAFAACAGWWIVGDIATQASLRAVGPPPSGLPVETVSFEGGHGSPVYGWYVEPPNSQASVLLLHGINADRRALLSRARFLRDAGYAVLMIDLQAHGESPGERITFGHLESANVSAAVNWLRTRRPAGKIAVIGLSLGGAAAVLAEPPLPVDVLVLEGVFSTLADATANRARIKVGAIGVPFVPLLMWQVELRLGFDPDVRSPANLIARAKAAVLVIAGDQDRRTTLENSRALFRNAPEPKSFWVIEGARHQDFHRFATTEYELRVLAFLNQHLTP